MGTYALTTRRYAAFAIEEARSPREARRVHLQRPRFFLLLSV